MKEKIIPLASIVIGIIAFILTWEYLRGKVRDLEEERERIIAGAKKVRVVAAATDIPQGVVISRRDIGTLFLFESSLTELEIMPNEAESILGKKTLRSIKAYRPLLWSDVEGGSPVSQGLAPMIKSGMRAISLAVGGAAAVSGMVAPNDRIDVLGTFSFPSKTGSNGEMEIVTLTMLQDVTVLATGQTLAKQPVIRGQLRTGASGYSTVTLEVTPKEAELLVFAQQVQGRLTLSLRNPADVSFEKDLPEINFQHIEKKLPELNQFRQQTIRRKLNL